MQVHEVHRMVAGTHHDCHCEKMTLLINSWRSRVGQGKGQAQRKGSVYEEHSPKYTIHFPRHQEVYRKDSLPIKLGFLQRKKIMKKNVPEATWFVNLLSSCQAEIPEDWPPAGSWSHFSEDLWFSWTSSSVQLLTPRELSTRDSVSLRTQKNPEEPRERTLQRNVHPEGKRYHNPRSQPLWENC